MTTDPAASAPANNCRRLTDFDGVTDIEWFIVNDGVMGGGSSGMIEFADSAMYFTGTVVTAGGGFTSVRLKLAGSELSDSKQLTLRVRSDGRTYGLTLDDGTSTGGRSISHRGDLVADQPADADGWQTIVLSYDELRPQVFGQPVDAAPFDPDRAAEFGFIIADGIDGDFVLEVDWIDACPAT